MTTPPGHRLLATDSSGAHDAPLGDGNYDEVVDAADYVVWRKFYGTTGPGSPVLNSLSGNPAVPEPGTLLMLAVGAAIMLSQVSGPRTAFDRRSPKSTPRDGDLTVTRRRGQETRAEQRLAPNRIRTGSRE